MSLASFSIRNSVGCWMATAAIFLFGSMALRGLGVSLYPDVDYPSVSVSVSYPGTPPELIETDIIEPLEGALSSIEGVERMTSSARYGEGSVGLDFKIGRDIDAVVQEVNSALQASMGKLPDGIEAPIVRKMNPDDRPIVWVALSGPDSQRELMSVARNQVLDHFTTLDGVGNITLGGFLEPVIRVWLNPKKLAEFDLSFEDILSTFDNEHREIPVGEILQDKKTLGLRFLGEGAKLSELEKIPITRRGGSLLFSRVTLGELGRIEAGLEDVRRFARSKGLLSVGFGIHKQRGTNSVAVADRVLEKINSVSLPKGYTLKLRFDTTQTIRKSVHELMMTLLISVVLTSLVCWLFFGSIASTINIIIGIPTSLFATFIFMSFAGFTLNLFTILALILAVGIVVDDAIMVLENIFRFRKTEPNTEIAAKKGAEQIQFAVLATTVAVIAIFIPVVFVGGMLGRYLAQFGIVLSVAVGVSALEALTFTPMRLARFKGAAELKGIPRIFGAKVEKLAEFYVDKIARLLNQSFAKQLVVYIAAFGVLVGAGFVLQRLPKEVVPKEGTGSFMVNIELPLGTPLEQTGKETEVIEEILNNSPYVESVYGIIGGSQTHSARLMVTLKESAMKETPQDLIENEFRKTFQPLAKNGVRARIQGTGGVALGGGGHRGAMLSLDLQGSDWKQLVEESNKLIGRLGSEPDFVDLDSSYRDGSPELNVVPDREKARLHGVSMKSLSETLAFVFNGISAARFNESGRRVPIIVRADPQFAPKNVENLKKLFVRNARSELIPLGNLVRVDETSAPATITRVQRQRTLSIYANLAPGFFLGASQEKAIRIAEDMLPPSIKIDHEQGSSSDLSKTLWDLLTALFLGVVVAYMVLASQFNSYFDPIIILLALPLSLAGAFYGLAAGGASINLFSGIGLLLLMGIVKKNSIMLVEFANQEREHGASLVEAVLASCRTRFRPILMTAFTTLACAVPPALKWGVDTQASFSMALVIIGGLLVSTLLTFFVVPLAYFHASRPRS